MFQRFDDKSGGDALSIIAPIDLSEEVNTKMDSLFTLDVILTN